MKKKDSVEKNELSANTSTEAYLLEKNKERARYLFTREKLQAKEIADKTGIKEQDIVAWIVDEKWDTIRKRLQTAKHEQLSTLYDVLDNLTGGGKTSSGDNIKTNLDGNSILRITTAINNLETEPGLGDIIDALDEFISRVIKENFIEAQIISKWVKIFVKEKVAEADAEGKKSLVEQ